MATTSDDGTTRIWDTQTGAPLVELGDRVGLRGPDGELTWPVPMEVLLRVGCERLAAFPKEYRAVRELCERSG